MFFRRRSVLKLRTAAVPVYLNIYDLTPINAYAYWLGLGVYHSGVEVHGEEYAYGAHDHTTTGIFEAEPRSCTRFALRKSILIGWTDLRPIQVRELMDELAHRYTGNTYDLISKNCNHFCNDACLRLTGNAIPRWVNRLAKLGFLCKCVLPVQVVAVRSRSDDGKDGGREGDRRRLRSGSIRYGGGGGIFGAAPSPNGRSRSSRRSWRPSSSSSTHGRGVTSVKDPFQVDMMNFDQQYLSWNSLRYLRQETPCCTLYRLQNCSEMLEEEQPHLANKLRMLGKAISGVRRPSMKMAVKAIFNYDDHASMLVIVYDGGSCQWWR